MHGRYVCNINIFNAYSNNASHILRPKYICPREFSSVGKDEFSSVDKDIMQGLGFEPRTQKKIKISLLSTW